MNKYRYVAPVPGNLNTRDTDAMLLAAERAYPLPPGATSTVRYTDEGELAVYLCYDPATFPGPRRRVIVERWHAFIAGFAAGRQG
jgi:hypothetical protein